MKASAPIDSLPEALRRVSEAAGLPRTALLALGILLLGLFLAIVVERIAHALTGRAAKVLNGLGRSNAPAMDTSGVERVVGRTSYWVVVAFSATLATEMLGLPVATAWLSGVATYLPRIAVAVAIWGLGILTGRAVRHMVTGAAGKARMPSARRLGRLSELAIWGGTTLVAIEQVGIEISFLKTTLMVAFAALLGGAAISFGLGGQRVAANILSAHYAQKLYRVGQTIRLDGVEGRIARITDTAVILECDEGEVAIPASVLSEERSLLVLKQGGQQ